MSEEAKSEVEVDEAQMQLLAQLAHIPFGPAFFLQHLTAFVRERCPDPKESLPLLHLHLADGEILDVCHIIGLSRLWIAVAVIEGTGEGSKRRMRTELVPYVHIARVTIRSAASGDGTVGFRSETPRLLSDSPEEALRSAGAHAHSREPRA
jgi:hypothetical protein